MRADVLKTHDDIEVASLNLNGHSEHCITVQSDQIESMQRVLCRAARDHDATILNQFVFAGTDHYEEFCRNSDSFEWPMVWLQGDACQGGDTHSMQAVALSGVDLEPIMFDGRDMGFCYEDDHARYCRLSGIVPQDLSAPRSEQARSVFESMGAVLHHAGFACTDTVRTWIYLDKLLEWYDDFNAVRTQYFNEAGISDHLVPVSTGIGASNPIGAAMVMDVLAVQPKTDSLTIREIASPMQNPAQDYRSSFSRALEMEYPTHRNLLISGTASINADGATVYGDDPEKQIRLTLDVVHAILQSRGMGWGDLFRGIAYFKGMDSLRIYERVAEELGIPPFPLAISHADICRHDLLFEMEVDAVKIR